MKKLFLLPLGLLIVLLFSGCPNHRPAPYLPTHWSGSEVGYEAVVDADEDKLQIFIMYQEDMCAHAALRIFSPIHGELFWDPAGGYGTAEFPIVAKRSRDLVVKPVPSAEDYLEFRRLLPTAKAELFEFTITSAQAGRLMNILQPKKTKEKGAAHFSTKTEPLFCSTAISGFLEQHAQDIVSVEKDFYPHNLAKMLYDQRPDRVLLWDYDKMLEFVPPG